MVTIIIPTYNEKDNVEKIESVLANIKGDFEVIFSDGFSPDGTYDYISYPKIQETKYRSNQMNAAAKYAKGDYLFFLHCDSYIGPDCVKLIEDSKLDAGTFSLKFEPTNPSLDFIEFFSNRRVKKKAIAFGDQGIFIKREIFESIGGYKPIPLMEDYQLSMDIKDAGYKLKQKDYPIYTSSRRLKKHPLITGFLMKVLQKMYRQGYDVEKIAKLYKRI
ncbi:TIGR04283 family arsenosugar biosynthesis glycosyltransferase [Anaerococcus sp. ENR0831]|uniref:4,4'-diaponeurosporenoate glycosyltransferase n=1 Tax=Anaerococcus martiniensis TaxID=3115615 RepID=A0ABW9M7Q9_9FIRM